MQYLYFVLVASVMTMMMMPTRLMNTLVVWNPPPPFSYVYLSVIFLVQKKYKWIRCCVYLQRDDQVDSLRLKAVFYSIYICYVLRILFCSQFTCMCVIFLFKFVSNTCKICGWIRFARLNRIFCAELPLLLILFCEYIMWYFTSCIIKVMPRKKARRC